MLVLGEKSHRERLIGPIIMLHSPSYQGGEYQTLEILQNISVVVFPRHIPVCIMVP